MVGEARLVKTGIALNVAVTVLLALSVTVHVVPDTAHSLLHESNTEPAAAAAESVTLLLVLKLAEQVLPQLMPAGLLVTVPVPVPARATVRVCVGVPTVTVTVASSEPPWPSVTRYVNVAVPVNPAGGVYRMVSSPLGTAVPAVGPATTTTESVDAA